MSSHDSAVKLAKMKAEQDTINHTAQYPSNTPSDNFLEDMSSIGIKSKPNRISNQSNDQPTHVALEDHDITLGGGQGDHANEYNPHRSGVCSSVTNWVSYLFTLVTGTIRDDSSKDAPIEREMDDFHRNPDRSEDIDRMTTINSTKSATAPTALPPSDVGDNTAPGDGNDLPPPPGSNQSLAIAEHVSVSNNLSGKIEDVPKTASEALP